jgi:type II secretory pathway pseudopilin PulG
MFAMGSPAGAGPLVLVMIIAILAAIAIPQFMTFKQRAEKVVMDGSLKEMASAAQQYQVTKGAWPCTFDELDLPGAAAMAKTKNWEVEVNCEHRLAAVIYKANDGKRHYRAIYFDSGEFEDGALKD